MSNRRGPYRAPTLTVGKSDWTAANWTLAAKRENKK
jgi:hypothetical protein